MFPGMEKQRLALHWQIAIGLVLGVIAGVLVNQYWTAESWASVGVNDPAAYMAGKAATPPPVTPDASIPPVVADPNAGAGFIAGAVKFAATATDFAGKLFLRCLRFIAVPIDSTSSSAACGMPRG